MVECEYQSRFHLMCKVFGFNRYMVECEFGYEYFIYADTDVLIDTWWNVNMLPLCVSSKVSVVLIDTWWNVNKDAGKLRAALIDVLIDTWWNVNVTVISVILPFLGF